MDGTGILFDRFAVRSPARYRPLLVPLPNRVSYPELTEAVSAALPTEGPFVIIAESFSGPIGVRLAARYAGRVVGLVLVNTFVVPPRSRAFRWVPWSYVFAFPPPRLVVRALLAGKNAPDQFVSEVCSAIAQTDARTMHARLRSILTVNEVENLERLPCPVLLLRGTRDRLVTRRSAEVIVRHARHSSTQALIAPHLLLQTQPDEAWRAIDCFIRDHSIA